MATQGKKLLYFVIGMHDARVIGRTDHDLVDVLVLALCAVMAGADGWDDIEDWGLENEAMLRQYLRLRNAIPGHDTIRRVFEVGYWCRKQFQGRGLVTEAVGGITRFAFSHLGAHRLSSFTDSENVASRRVLERAGFALEGIMRNDRITPDGVLRSTCVYGITP